MRSQKGALAYIAVCVVLTLLCVAWSRTHG